ncbi:MAG: right-handed parallel beta-helix repeat-containing protein [Flavobacteriales bacterium]
MIKNITLILISILLISTISAQTTCNCDYTVNSWHYKLDGEDMGNMPHITIHDSLNAANHPLSNVKYNPKLSLNPGDIICVDGSASYSFMRWENIKGTAQDPIIIKNINGQVKIKNLTNANQKVVASYGWMFRESQNFKLLGNGDSTVRYGFKVTTHLNSYIQMIRKTSDFEIAHVEIAGDYAGGTNPLCGFAGIIAKSQPVCWDDTVNGGSTDSSNFELKNVYIHDNYIHDVGGEGMYIGYGKSKGVQLNGCSRKNYPHNVRNLYVYNNIIDNVGWDGIQIKNAHYNAQVYNNVIKNYGNRLNGNHDEGLFVGDGSEAIIHGNWIENGTRQSAGMKINGFGNTKIYNNVILKPGNYGLYINNNSGKYANRDGVFEIYNNTIEGGTNKFAVVAYSPQPVIAMNNIIFGFKDVPLYKDGIKAMNDSNISSNIVESIIDSIGFKNYNKGDIRLKLSSIAFDSGTILNNYNQRDFSTTFRANGNIDIGAIETGTIISKSNVDAVITIPSTDSILVQPQQAIPIKVYLKDSNNKVKMVQYYLNNRLIGTDAMPRKTEHVIGNRHFLTGFNTFKVKVTLYGGYTIFSDPIIMNNPVQAMARSLGIKENEEKDLTISYINGTKELIITNPDNAQIQTIELFDIQGKRISYWRNIGKSNSRLIKKIDHSLSGIYVIRVQTNRKSFSKKIVLTP